MQIAAGAIVCGNTACTWTLNAIPEHKRCVICGRGLTASQIASRVCANAQCQHKWLVERSTEFTQSRTQMLEAEAVKARRIAAIEAGVANELDYPVAMIPFFDTKVSKLPRARKQKLRAHLERKMDLVKAHQSAVADGLESAREPKPPIPTLPSGTEKLLVHACTNCKGFCCRTGGERAWITTDTLIAYGRAHPEASREQIIDTYLSYLPERTFVGGCVYQTSTGCALPREIRSDTCNRYFCGPLTDVRDRVGEQENPKAFFVPTHDIRFENVVFASAELVQIVRYRSTTMDQ